MTRFASPALYQPDLRVTPALIRSALGLAATLLTGVLWLAAGSAAGQYGDGDRTPRFELEPVVITGHRALPAEGAIAMGAAAAGDCGNTQAGAGPNRVTLSQ